MNRGAFERRYSRLDEALRELRFNRQALLIGFATEEETHRLLELLGNRQKIKESSRARAAPEDIAEIVALFETFTKRLKKRLTQE